MAMIGVLVGAAFLNSAALRDTEQRMAEIIYSTRIGRLDYVLARFIGAFIATYLVYVAAVSPLLFPLLLKRKTPIGPGAAPWILGFGLLAGLVSLFTGYISIVGIWILGLLLIWGIVRYFR